MEAAEFCINIRTLDELVQRQGSLPVTSPAGALPTGFGVSASPSKKVSWSIPESHPQSCLCTGVVVDGEEIEADAVVIAMGPWSGQAAKWLPVPSITGQKYASIVLRPEEEISNHMLFLSYKTSSGWASHHPKQCSPSFSTPASSTCMSSHIARSNSWAWQSCWVVWEASWSN